MASAVKKASSAAKEAALLPFYKTIDEVVTSKCKAFFEMSDNYSDVVVQKGNISIVNAYAKPEKFNELLTGKAAFKIKSLHIGSLILKIPWFNWSAGVEIELDSLLMVMQPLGHDHWTLEEVRAVKEQEIIKEVEKLLKAEMKSGKGKKGKKSDEEAEKPTLFSRVKQQLIDNASIRLKVTNVHFRYEQFGDVDSAVAAGVIVSSCTASKEGVEREHLKTSAVIGRDLMKVELNAGIYCRTPAHGRRRGGSELCVKSVEPDEAAPPLDSRHTSLQEESVSTGRDPGAKFRLPRTRSPVGGGEKDAFFSRQVAIANRMKELIEDSQKWERGVWLLSPVSLTASMRKVARSEMSLWKGRLNDSDNPAGPHVQMELAIPQLQVNTTELQLSRIISVANQQSLLKLRAAYSLRLGDPEDVGRPKRGEGARAFWRAAVSAILITYRPAKGGAGLDSIDQTLALKRTYVDLIVDHLGGWTGEVAEFKQACKALDPPVQKQLQHIEDECKAVQVAWWRLVGSAAAQAAAQAAAAAAKKGGGRDSKVDGSGSGSPEQPSRRARAATAIQSRIRGKKTRETIKEGGRPDVKRNNSSSRRGFAHRLKAGKDGLGMDADESARMANILAEQDDKAPPLAEQLAALAPQGFMLQVATIHIGTIGIRLIQAADEDELLCFGMGGVFLRQRSLARNGKKVHVVVRSLQVSSGLMTPQGVAPAWRMLRIVGDEVEGGGKIPEALLGGALSLPGTGPAATKKNKKVSTGTLAAGADHDGADDRVALYVIAHQRPKKGKKGEAAEPSKLELHVGLLEYTYNSGFWNYMATFMSAIENEMQSSPKQATSQLRARYPRMLRGLSEHLRRPWWVGEIKGMTAFVSAVALLNAPAGFPFMRVVLSGCALKMETPPDDADETMMSLGVPPLEVERIPNGDGADTTVRFLEPISCSTPRVEGLFARLLEEGNVVRGVVPQSCDHVLHNVIKQLPPALKPPPPLSAAPSKAGPRQRPPPRPSRRGSSAPYVAIEAGHEGGRSPRPAMPMPSSAYLDHLAAKQPAFARSRSMSGSIEGKTRRAARDVVPFFPLAFALLGAAIGGAFLLLLVWSYAAPHADASQSELFWVAVAPYLAIACGAGVLCAASCASLLRCWLTRRDEEERYKRLDASLV